VSEQVILRAQGFWPKVDLLIPLGALGFAGYEALNTIYWSGFVIFIGPVVVYGVVRLWNLLVRYARLSPARLDYFNGFWWHGIDRTDVKGYRIRTSRGGQWYELVHKDAEVRPCSIPQWLFDHPDAKYWFVGFIDLRPIEKTAANAALEADPALGADKPTRLRRITVLKVLAAVLSVTAFALFCAAILTNFCVRGLLGAFVILTPIGFALDLLFAGQFRFVFESEGRDARPTLVALYTISGLLVPAGAAGALHIQDGMSVFGAALLVGFALTGYVLWRAPVLRRNVVSSIVMAVFMIGYTAFALSYLNIVLDTGTQRSYPTVIQNLETRHVYVDIAPWADERWSDSVAVTRSKYHQLHVGQPVCVYVGKGAFGFGWYEIGDCDGKNPHDRY